MLHKLVKMKPVIVNAAAGANDDLKLVTGDILETGQRERIVFDDQANFGNQIRSQALGFEQDATAETDQPAWPEGAFEMSCGRVGWDVTERLPEAFSFGLPVMLAGQRDNFLISAGLDVPDDVGQGQTIGCLPSGWKDRDDHGLKNLMVKEELDVVRCWLFVVRLRRCRSSARMTNGSELLRFEGFFVVLLDELFDVGDFVVDFFTDLGEGDESFVPPGLGGAGGDFHHADEIGVVEVLLGEGLLRVIELLLDFFEVVDKVLVLSLG